MNFIKRQGMNLLLSAVAVLCVVVGANAEIHDNAFGLRVGLGTQFGGELDYQKKMGENNRLQLGISYNYDSELSGSASYGSSSVSYGLNWICAVGFYHWHWDIDTKGLGFYVGPGADMGILTWSYEINFLGYRDKFSYTGFSMSIGGEAGIEYDLNVSKTPLLLSLDIRPMIGLTNSRKFNFCVGLSGRYTF
jgi:hypothetical protein